MHLIVHAIYLYMLYLEIFGSAPINLQSCTSELHQLFEPVSVCSLLIWLFYESHRNFGWHSYNNPAPDSSGLQGMIYMLIKPSGKQALILQKQLVHRRPDHIKLVFLR